MPKYHSDVLFEVDTCTLGAGLQPMIHPQFSSIQKDLIGMVSYTSVAKGLKRQISQICVRG